MTEKQLRYRIRVTKEALYREQQRNNEKMSNVGWGSGFRKAYTGPCCSREMDLKVRLQGYEKALVTLLECGEAK